MMLGSDIHLPMTCAGEVTGGGIFRLTVHTQMQDPTEARCLPLNTKPGNLYLYFRIFIPRGTHNSHPSAPLVNQVWPHRCVTGTLTPSSSPRCYLGCRLFL